MPYSAEQMFDLVADVKAYQEFLPWVIAMRVRKDRPHSINVEYVEGPLKYLHNDWRFRPDGDGCLVDFSVDFAFKNRMFEMLAGQVFTMALRKMIGAFEERARVLYASPSGEGSGGISSSSAHSAA